MLRAAPMAATHGHCRHALSTLLRSSAPSCSIHTPTLLTGKRHFTNALWRLPPQNMIPTHSPSGEEVDVELFEKQVRGLFSMMKLSQLCEQAHEMRSCPYYDCMFTNDILFQHFSIIFPMPKFGREHRSAEMSETLRYVRGCGASADIQHILQDAKGARASGADFVSTMFGILMGYGTHRTNKIAMMTLTGVTADSPGMANQVRAWSVEPIEMLPDSPPLADILAFAGSRTLLVEDSVHGKRAAEQALERIPNVKWSVLKLEPGCSFLSHVCAPVNVFDVLCDQDFPESMERIGESGLNPFPVEWSEPRKLGITMRSICLTARFNKGGMSAGGYANSFGHRHSQFNYNSKDMAKNARLFSGGRRRHGDSGAPLEAQIRSMELPEPSYQSPPRYVPPMHRRGAPLVQAGDGKEE